jgi:hypothetical protein
MEGGMNTTNTNCLTDARLMMHVAVQAARHTLETTGLCLQSHDTADYAFYSTEALDPWLGETLGPDEREAHLAELAQASKLLVRLHLAVKEEYKGKVYMRLKPHVEEYMQVLA